ncbi:acetyl-CoA decarbonylase/synthase complex subunit gamma [Methanoregula sp.]|uniref:acetyl-CoA decarbonylase/synthase complex subunit gamma n=1 Tax=Methanoregula sp. TaxID=2052170 RepID=UPI002633BBB7|nr:acetyl-CoA decarbonylase/synthase complex subunit gamma [Methanoregula sp.]MDD5141822.1 acetyl-CoA decarbonylase/synthase complex subunit gamma [Methanoregula sp.]
MTPAAPKKKKSIREISPIDVYKLLPRTNCGECGEANCMAYATRLVNGELLLADCPQVHTEEYASPREKLEILLAPPVRTVTIGTGDYAMDIGGKYVLQRHDFTYHNPTPIAIDVNDLMKEEELIERVRRIGDFSYNYIGRKLTLNAIAIRSVSNDPEKFRNTVRTVSGASRFPLILCALDARVMAAGLEAAKGRRPLIYAATESNWKEMADLALLHNAPLAVFAPNDLALLRSLVATLLACGIRDLVLDPGTFPDEGLGDTITNFTAIRTAATKQFDDLFGFPLLGVPLTVWAGSELSEDVLKWREAITASMLISRYSDLLIMHSLDGWVILPQLIWRFNLYTDPRKPVSVEAGVRTFGRPDTRSPVLITTNYALTYFTVESDIKSANLDCYLIVADTGGLSVESAVAGRNFTAEDIARALNENNVSSLVSHTTLIIPGLAARLSGETEEATGWKILVGPKDSSGISQFLRDRWPVES